MIRETFTRARVDIPKPNGGVFRIEVQGALTPEDEQLLMAVEATPKLLTLVKQLVFCIREDNDRAVTGIFSEGTWDTVRGAEALLAKLGGAQ